MSAATLTLPATRLPDGLNPQQVTRRAVVAELADLRAQHGAVPERFVKSIADEIGRHPRTLRRWLAESELPNGEASSLLHQQPTQPLTDDEIEVVFAHGGCLTRAYRDLRKARATNIGSLTSFRRAWERLDPAVRAMARDGADELKAMQLRTRWTAPARNHTWQIDHEELPIWVLPRGRKTPEKPWLTVIEDDNTRYVMSVLVTFGRPGAEQVIATVADAIRRKATTRPGHWVGGVPHRIIADNGAEFASQLYLQSLARLGITRRRTYPYSGHQKGKLERFNRTSQEEFVAGLPGYSHGPRTARNKDLFGRNATILDEQVFVELLLDWVERYNTERSHSALGGRTPLEAWCEQSTPLREVDPDALRLAMLVEAKPRKVQPEGVFFDNRYYTRGTLGGYVGRKVTVRHLPYDRSFIEVFDGDTWVCTAFPHPDLTEAELDELEQQRREQYTVARAYLTASAERRELALEASGQPRLAPTAAVVRDDDLSDGDAELLRLLEPQADTRPALLSDDPPSAPVPEGGATAPTAAAERDPWELPAEPAADDDLSVLDDLEGFDAP